MAEHGLDGTGARRRLRRHRLRDRRHGLGRRDPARSRRPASSGSATLRPIALPGGDRAIREVWRIARGAPRRRFRRRRLPSTPSPSFRRSRPAGSISFAQMAARGIQAPLARGVGRYFDALGALFLARPVSRYEGQVALEWNLAADDGDRGAYPFEHRTGPRSPDARPAPARPGRDRRLPRRSGGRPRSPRASTTRSPRATAALVRAAAREARPASGRPDRRLLPERAAWPSGFSPPSPAEFSVHLHGDVPPGDGGLALGQALVAAAVARRTEGGL